MPPAYPLMLDVADRLVVIVGGGRVAVRKAKGLIDCGATRVRCVSPSIDSDMPASVEQIESNYDVQYLEGATLVFAATDDPNINATIVRDTRRLNILVNRADNDDAEPSDFSTPAKWSESGITVTVSASGNPALAATIRDAIRETWDPRWSAMAEAMKMIRPTILTRRDLSQQRRSEIFRSLATNEAMSRLSDAGPAALFAWIVERFPELQNA